jgi:Zn-finger nucleic acid-binding protein
MKTCPVCDVELNRTLLEANLPAYSCPSCYGIWVSANEYLDWLAPQAGVTVDDIDIAREFDFPHPISEKDRKAIFCPDCGRYLRRYRIWPNADFRLDRCSHCNGIWFDNHEWQTLQSQNLHKHVNIFFTQAWKEKLRSEEMKQRFERMYREKFGPEDYQKIQEIRAWLTNHPLGVSLLAYLTDRDPYKG